MAQNTATALVNQNKPSIFAGNKVVLRPLALGKHTIKFVSLEEKVAQPKKGEAEGNPYLQFQFSADGEPHLRLKNVYEIELGMLCNGLAKQDEAYYEKSQQDIILDLVTTQREFSVWLVENPNKGYGPNWYYQEPATQQEFFTEEYEAQAQTALNL